jgi:hypothetical protein
MSGSCRARDEAEIVCGDKIGFVQAMGGAFPFCDCLALETHYLEGHDGHVHHLCHCVGWHGNDGCDKTVFKAVKVGFDGVCWVPWGTKKCIVGLFFGQSRAAIEGAEHK